jgi:hypothetical protein
MTPTAGLRHLPLTTEGSVTGLSLPEAKQESAHRSSGVGPMRVKLALVSWEEWVAYPSGTSWVSPEIVGQEEESSSEGDWGLSWSLVAGPLFLRGHLGYPATSKWPKEKDFITSMSNLIGHRPMASDSAGIKT